MFTQESEAQLIEYPQFDRDRHGGLYDRGRADSWYRRPADPHWYPEGSYNGVCVRDLNSAERDEYMAGYRDNEASGDHKEWD